MKDTSYTSPFPRRVTKTYMVHLNGKFIERTKSKVVVSQLDHDNFTAPNKRAQKPSGKEMLRGARRKYFRGPKRSWGKSNCATV